jgi:outer membrane protein OmpA-like peptidoglycan-associated protein
VQRNAAGAGPTGLVGLQSAIGNHAMRRLIDSPFIQAKLEVSTPEDPQEQEADKVADTVMRMPDPGPIQRIRLSGSEEEGEGEQVSDAPFLVQRSPDDKPTLEESAGGITERSEEKTWSQTSDGIVEEEKPGEKFILMNFAINESNLKKDQLEFLQKTVFFGTLSSDPMAKVIVVGHADSTGEKARNDALAKQRAKAVQDALNTDVHKPRFETVTGKGSREPIASNDTVLGRARNRRVEIVVKPWKPTKPLADVLKDLQKGIKPFVFNVNNFAACPFKDTVKRLVDEVYKPIPVIQFDWEGKTAGAEGTVNIDDTTPLPGSLGLNPDIFINSFKNNEICKVKGDPATCEKVFTPTADVMGRAIANTIAHEAGHEFSLSHVPATNNVMWSPEQHPLGAKKNKTFDEQIMLQRTLQSLPEAFNGSQLAHIVTRIPEKRKKKPGVIDF